MDSVRPTSPPREHVVRVLLLRHWPKGLFALLALASVVPFWGASHCNWAPGDDTFIVYTYAKSLAAGRGFVFNHPPATLAATTPLLTLLLAAIAAISHSADFVRMHLLLSACCWTAAAWSIVLLRRGLRLELWEAALLGVVLLGAGQPLALLSEYFLFEFLLVLTVALHWNQRRIWAGVCAGLLFLTRGEGALALPVLLGACAWEERSPLKRGLTRLFRRGSGAASEAQEKPGGRSSPFRGAARLCLGFLIPFLLWSVYALKTFGAILPDSMHAKMAQYESQLWGSFARSLFTVYIPNWELQFAIGHHPGLNLWWGLVLLGAFHIAARNPRWLLFPAWAALYIAGYAALGVPDSTTYQAPVHFVALIVSGFGFVALIHFALRLKGSLRIVSVCGAVAAVAGFLYVMIPYRAALHLQARGDWTAPTYTQMGLWFHDNTQPSQSVAYIEIGRLGYYSGNRIIDLAGLLDPEVARHVARRDFAWEFYRALPDYYVHLADFDWALKDIRANPEFGKRYEPVAGMPSPTKSDFVIYARRDLNR